MAVTAPETCDLDFCLRQLTLALGIADPNYPDGSEVAGAAPYTQADLIDRLAIADYEINSVILSVLDHPYRSQFDTEETAALDDRDKVPAHLGDYSIATIVDEDGSGSESEELIGRRAQNLAHIEKVRANPSLYGSPEDLYFVHAGRVHLGDPSRQIIFNIPKIEILRADPSATVRTFDDIDVLNNASLAHSDTPAQNFTLADVGRRLDVPTAGLNGTILALVNAVAGASVDVIIGDTATSTQNSANATLYERSLPTLQAPVLYQWAVIAKAVVTCAMQGFMVPHRAYWFEVMKMYLSMIQGKSLSLPEPDRLARIGT